VEYFDEQKLKEEIFAERMKFLQFFTSKILYFVEEIYAVEGFLLNFAELIF